MADDSIVGGWELVSDSRVGVSIYTDSHFSTVMAAKNRQRSSDERATPDEALEPCLPARPYPAPTPSLDCQGRREIVPAGRSKTIPLSAAV